MPRFIYQARLYGGEGSLLAKGLFHSKIKAAQFLDHQMRSKSEEEVSRAVIRYISPSLEKWMICKFTSFSKVHSIPPKKPKGWGLSFYDLGDAPSSIMFMNRKPSQEEIQSLLMGNVCSCVILRYRFKKRWHYYKTIENKILEMDLDPKRAEEFCELNHLTHSQPLSILVEHLLKEDSLEQGSFETYFDPSFTGE